MYRLVAYLALGLALSSCNHRQQVPLTGSDHVSGWADQIRRTAADSYVYAQLSSNVYNEAPLFVIPSVTELELVEDDGIGFGYGLYRRTSSSGADDLIIAFRGTDFSQRDDWKYGNIVPLHNQRGLAEFRRIRKAHPGVPITVTGHSLGGGVATYVSLVEPVSQSIVFNSSPRFRAPRNPVVNKRTSIVEYGEVLKATRIFGREADQLYMSIGCTRGNPVRQHTMRSLAECLTGIAAFESAPALESLRLNPAVPRPTGLPPIQ